MISISTIQIEELKISTLTKKCFLNAIHSFDIAPSLILLEINKTIEDIPKTMTIASIILDDVMNDGMFSTRAFELPKMNPHIMENNDRLMLFPTSLLVDNIADASDNSF